MSCFLNGVTKSKDFEKLVEKMDDASKKKLLESLMKLAEQKVSDQVKDMPDRIAVKYSIKYGCDGKKLDLRLISSWNMRIFSEDTNMSHDIETKHVQCRAWLNWTHAQRFVDDFCGCCGDKKEGLK